MDIKDTDFRALRSTFFVLAGILLLDLFFLNSCHLNHLKEVAPEYTNVVIVFTDDQGYNDLGCFGSPDIVTPNIDRLASEGAILTNFYTAQPVCTASRVSLLTGCYPNRLGLHGALGPGSQIGIHEEELTLAELLKEAGYETGIFGKWHLGDGLKFHPMNHGFNTFFGIPYSNDMWPYHPWQGSFFNFPPLPLWEDFIVIDTLEDQTLLTKQITEKSVEFIRSNKDRPFFLYVPHPQPHVPLFVSEEFRGKSDRGLYGDVIMEIDWSVGQILTALREEGLEENTLVIFTSDNGPWLSYGGHAGSAYPLREGKGTTWDGGIRVPCVMKYPRDIEAGTLIHTPVMTIDLLPTIAQLVKRPLPSKKIDGKNIWPVVTGLTENSPHEAYYYYYSQNELQAIRAGEWKLILPHRYRTLNGREGTDDGFPIPYEYGENKFPELYHITEDPGEMNNVAHLYPERLEYMLELAQRIRKDLGDSATGDTGAGRREPGRID